MARNDWDINGKNWKSDSKPRSYIQNSQSTKIGNARMPYGKFKGCPLSQIPTEHLQWIYNNDGLEELKGEIFIILKQRKKI